MEKINIEIMKSFKRFVPYDAIEFYINIVYFFLWVVTLISIFRPDYIEQMGLIGDAIGGIIGTIVSLIGIFVIFSAFKAQLDANTVLRESNNIIRTQGYQQIDLLKESNESLQHANLILIEQGKEQKKLLIESNETLMQSNKILQEKEEANFILEQIKLLENIEFTNRYLDFKNKLSNGKSDKDLVEKGVKILYVISELELTIDLIEEFSGVNYKSIKRKLSSLFLDKFVIDLVDLKNNMNNNLRHTFSHDSEEMLIRTKERIDVFLDKMLIIKKELEKKTRS